MSTVYELWNPILSGCSKESLDITGKQKDPSNRGVMAAFYSCCKTLKEIMISANFAACFICVVSLTWLTIRLQYLSVQTHFHISGLGHI
jgi:hypothetical protein